MNFREWLKSKSEYLITCMAVLCVLVVAMILCPPYYSMNDDAMMKSILSGAYTGTPDGHTVYMKYPLSGILSLLYRITDKISWFDLFMVGCFLVAVSSVIIRVRSMLKGQSEKKKRNPLWLVAGISVLCFALFLPQLFTLHYTLVAAMVGSCGLFLLMTGGGVVSIILLLLCYCIRSQVFFMLLPFLAVVVLWHVLDKNIKPMLKQVLILAVGVILCMAWNGIMYRSADWDQYMVYNDSRTRLYDYDKLLPYEGNAERYEEAGISSMQHRIMDEYGLVLDDGITPEMMDKAAEITASSKRESRTGAEYLIYCVKEYYYHLRYNDQPYNYILIGGCLIVLVLLVQRREWLKLALLGCLLGGRSLIWVFLIWRGRFPERVSVSLYFLDIMILAGMILELILRQKSGEKVFKEPQTGAPDSVAKSTGAGGKWSVRILGAVVCAFLLWCGVSQCMVMSERTIKQAKKHEEWLALTEYCAENPETMYLLDVLSMVDYSGKVWDAADQKENFLLAGGWMSASPLLEARLKTAESGNSCYIISADRDVDWLFEYCEECLDGLQLEKTDSISLNGKVLFHVYRQAEE